MARYTGPKDKLSRREGFDLFGKGAKLTRLSIPPGQHGPKRSRKLSEYGRQLREKQKVKRFYGILERQFKRYIEQAGKSRGNKGEQLISYLERRLDNVVYRLGLAPTRTAARQLVSHGHVLVNSRKVKIPSYSTKVDDIITLASRAQKIPAVAKLLGEKNPQVASWVERQGPAGRVIRLPVMEDVVEPIDAQTVVEFYSR